jgi:hypothetical protein
MSIVKEQIIEQIGDAFGVTVRYEIGEYGKVTIDFYAAEVIAVAEDGTKFYARAGSGSSEDDTDEFDFAARLVSGSVKWDGCSHYNFGEGGYLHMHSRGDLETLSNALAVIYERCGELMQANGGHLLEGEFAVERG